MVPAATAAGTTPTASPRSRDELVTLVEAMPGGSFAARPAPGRSASSLAGVGAGHPAVRALSDLGLLDPVASALVRVEDLSRAHPVWSVVLPDGRRLVVKSSAPERGLDLGVEFLVYRWRCGVSGPGRLPEALVVDEDQHLLVLADARGSDTDASGSLGPRAPIPPPRPEPRVRLRSRPLARARAPRRGAWVADRRSRGGVPALGRTLGALHRGTTGLPLPPARQPVVLAALTAEYPPPGRLPSTSRCCVPTPSSPTRPGPSPARWPAVWSTTT